MLQDMRRGSFLSESSSTDSSDERAWVTDYAGVKVEGPFKGEHQLHCVVRFSRHCSRWQSRAGRELPEGDDPRTDH